MKDSVAHLCEKLHEFEEALVGVGPQQQRLPVGEVGADVHLTHPNTQARHKAALLVVKQV